MLVGYARVSTQEQNSDLQLVELREYCRIRSWEITRKYIDHESGINEARPALNELMHDAACRRFQTVLVWKFDRFARSVHQLLEALRFFHGLGIDFVSVTEAIDTTTPVGKMVFTVLRALAAFERDLLIERVRAGMDRARVAGRHMGRPAKQVDPEEIARLHVDEGLNFRQIAKRLGVSPTKISRTMRACVQKGLPEF